jgi:hypothetical protein
MTIDSHRHDRVVIPAYYADPAGRPVDHQLLARLLGAMLDRCGLCTELLLLLLAEDSLTTARLVELCCIGAREQTDISARCHTPDTSDVSAMAVMLPAQFWELAQTGLASGSGALSRRCQRMSAEQRREAARYAMAVLIQQLVTELTGGISRGGPASFVITD